MNCTSQWTTWDLSAGVNATSLAMQEIFASFNQKAPIALIPEGDDFTLNVLGVSTINKLNLYRAGVNQPPTTDFAVDGSKKTYCTNLINTGAPRLISNMNRLSKSPSPTAGVNLYSFLKTRYEATIGPNGLNCVGLGITTTLPNAAAILPSNSTNANANANANIVASPGLIAGVVISGVAFILILLGTRFLLMRRRRNKNKSINLNPPPPQSNDSYLNANNPLIYPTSRFMSGGPSSV